MMIELLPYLAPKPVHPQDKYPGYELVCVDLIIPGVELHDLDVWVKYELGDAGDRDHEFEPAGWEVRAIEYRGVDVTDLIDAMKGGTEEIQVQVGLTI